MLCFFNVNDHTRCIGSQQPVAQPGLEVLRTLKAPFQPSPVFINVSMFNTILRLLMFSSNHREKHELMLQQAFEIAESLKRTHIQASIMGSNLNCALIVLAPITKEVESTEPTQVDLNENTIAVSQRLNVMSEN